MHSLKFGLCGSLVSLGAGIGLFVQTIGIAPANGCAQQSTAAPIDVYDGFETPALSELSETSRFTAGAVEMQSNVVRAGHGAVKITVRPRDTFEAGRNGYATRTRGLGGDGS